MSRVSPFESSLTLHLTLFIHFMSETPPIVAYGSQRGAAQRVAQTIAKSLGVTAIQLNHLRMDALSRAQVAIIAISTFANGQYPSNASSFADNLQCYGASLSQLRFAVIALGSTFYPNFCRAGIAVFDGLVKHEATPLLPLVRSDRASHDAGEGAIEHFVSEVLKILAKAKAETGVAFQAIPKEPLSLLPNGFSIVNIRTKFVVSADGYVPVLRRYVIDLPTGASAVAGGQVLVLPENDPAVASAVVSKLKLDPDAAFAVTDPIGELVIPPKVTVRDLFLKYVDLSCPVPPKLAQFAGVASAASTSVGQFLLSEFNADVKDISQFFTVLPQINPRTYSIASEKPAVAELVVGDIRLPDGRPGLSTGFLARKSTLKIAVEFIDGEFKYPTTPETPLILVALGTGIAPILSVLEHRRRGGFGPCFVIYGIRVREAAAALLTELEGFKTAGVINELWIAVSRAEAREHVQDVINANGDKIWTLWSDPATELFYCGTPPGFESVRLALVAVTQQLGKRQQTQAAMFTARHKITVEAY
jgi:sulfite reductase alpha subunit-like flavoprotein